MILRQIIKEQCLMITRKIVDKQFENLYRDDYQKRMPVDAMRQCMEEYGHDFTMPPDAAFDNMQVYDISENEVSVDCPLWFQNEGSDLTIIINLKVVDGIVRYAIDDIHIL